MTEAQPATKIAPTPRPQRRNLWAIVMASAVAAVVLVMALWDWNWIRPALQRQASAALGRDVVLRHVTVVRDDGLWWRVSLVADDITIANPTGFDAGPPDAGPPDAGPPDAGPPDKGKPFATIGQLAVLFDLDSIMRTRGLVIERVTLNHVQADIRENASGATNWLFPELATPTGSSAGLSTAVTTPVRDLEILDANIHVVVPSQHSDVALVIATGPMAEMQPRQFSVDATGTYAGQPITGRLVGGGLLSLRDAAHPFPVDLHISNGATRISLTGTMLDPLALTGADLKLELSGPDMALVMPFAGFAIPKTPSFRISGTLDFSDGKVMFHHFSGIVGSSDIDGELTVAPGPPRPVVTGTLHSRAVDLADLGGIIGSEPGRMTTPNQTSEQRSAVARAEASPLLLPTIPLNLPVIRKADIHLTYRGDKIQGRSVPFDSMDARIDIDDGRIRLSPLTLGVGSGQIVATLDLTPQSDEVHTVADVSFQKLDVGRLMAATQLVKGSGVLGGKAVITSNGNSMSTLLSRGDGSVQLFLASGGTVSALVVDISGFQIGNALLSALGVPNREPVNCFVSDFALQRGLLQARTFLIDTKSNIITGSGDINLATEMFNLRLKTDSKHFSVGTLPAPFAITGPFKDPSIRPDLATLGARVGAATGLGVLFPPAALLPTIQFGVGEDNACATLLRSGGRAK